MITDPFLPASSRVVSILQEGLARCATTQSLCREQQSVATPTGRERMGSHTLQTLQDPILLCIGSGFFGGFPNPRSSVSRASRASFTCKLSSLRPVCSRRRHAGSCAAPPVNVKVMSRACSSRVRYGEFNPVATTVPYSFHFLRR
jgi:hypothetical protein